MQNYHAVETEAIYRHRERLHEARLDRMTAQGRPAGSRGRHDSWPRLPLAGLRVLAARYEQLASLLTTRGAASVTPRCVDL